MYEIKYTSKYTGKEQVHKCDLNESEARGWAENLARDNNCKATAEYVANGPYDYSGKRTHIVTVGDNG